MKIVLNERTKLTASDLNTAAGVLFGAVVAAPIAAAVFGLAGPAGHLPTLILGLGALIFLIASLALHAAACYVLKRLQPWPTFRSSPSSSCRWSPWPSAGASRSGRAGRCKVTKF